jgi:hypothetical protein
MTLSNLETPHVLQNLTISQDNDSFPVETCNILPVMLIINIL